MHDAARLIADEQGIWQEHVPGQRFGIAWSDIRRVSGYALDLPDRVELLLDVEHANGDSFEVNASSPGFDAVAAALTERLAGFASDALTALRAQPPHGDVLVLWPRT